MRVYLSGQRSFGYAVLDLLRKRGEDIAGVSAPPESEGAPDRLYSAATKLGLPVMAAGRLNAATLPPRVDLIVCAHSHEFIGRATRTAAKLGALGYHPSLLPVHRGRDAVRWTVRLRERITGGTAFWLNDQVDGGPIAAQAWCHVRPDDTASSLWRRELFPMGLRLLGQVLADIDRGRIVSVPQDAALATWEPSLESAPLFRPDLPQIGPAPAGFTVERQAEAIR